MGDGLVIGVDMGEGESVCVEDRYYPATAKFPKGRWLRRVGGEWTDMGENPSVTNPNPSAPVGGEKDA